MNEKSAIVTSRVMRTTYYIKGCIINTNMLLSLNTYLALQKYCIKNMTHMSSYWCLSRGFHNRVLECLQSITSVRHSNSMSKLQRSDRCRRAARMRFGCPLAMRTTIIRNTYWFGSFQGYRFVWVKLSFLPGSHHSSVFYWTCQIYNSRITNKPTNVLFVLERALMLSM